MGVLQIKLLYSRIIHIQNIWLYLGLNHSCCLALYVFYFLFYIWKLCFHLFCYQFLIFMSLCFPWQQTSLWLSKYHAPALDVSSVTVLRYEYRASVKEVVKDIEGIHSLILNDIKKKKKEIKMIWFIIHIQHVNVAGSDKTLHKSSLAQIFIRALISNNNLTIFWLLSCLAWSYFPNTWEKFCGINYMI